MSRSAEVVVGGFGFCEGPAWCPDGTVACTDVALGLVYRVWPSEQRHEVIARTGGGANAAARASDGGFLVTQSGGYDFSALFGPSWPHPFVPAPPGIQRIRPDGSVVMVTRGSYQSPNDLVVAPDGTLYFTDPVLEWEAALSRVQAMDRDGTTRVVGSGFAFCNGIALDLDDQLVIVERYGLMRLHLDGSREWIVEQIGPDGGDGFCLDVEGNYYVAARTDHVVRVLDPRGREIEVLTIPDAPDGTPGFTTNCCFGGPDGRTLFATDGRPGQLVVWEQMPIGGRVIHEWRA